MKGKVSSFLRPLIGIAALSGSSFAAASCAPNVSDIASLTSGAGGGPSATGAGGAASGSDATVVDVSVEGVNASPVGTGNLVVVGGLATIGQSDQGPLTWFKVASASLNQATLITDGLNESRFSLAAWPPTMSPRRQVLFEDVQYKGPRDFDTADNGDGTYALAAYSKSQQAILFADRVTPGESPTPTVFKNASTAFDVTTSVARLGGQTLLDFFPSMEHGHKTTESLVLREQAGTVDLASHPAMCVPWAVEGRAAPVAVGDHFLVAMWGKNDCGHGLTEPTREISIFSVAASGVPTSVLKKVVTAKDEIFDFYMRPRPGGAWLIVATSSKLELFKVGSDGSVDAEPTVFGDAPVWAPFYDCGFDAAPTADGGLLMAWQVQGDWDHDDYLQLARTNPDGALAERGQIRVGDPSINWQGVGIANHGGTFAIFLSNVEAANEGLIKVVDVAD